MSKIDEINILIDTNLSDYEFIIKYSMLSDSDRRKFKNISNIIISKNADKQTAELLTNKIILASQYEEFEKLRRLEWARRAVAEEEEKQRLAYDAGLSALYDEILAEEEEKQRLADAGLSALYNQILAEEEEESLAKPKSNIGGTRLKRRKRTSKRKTRRTRNSPRK